MKRTLGIERLFGRRPGVITFENGIRYREDPRWTKENLHAHFTFPDRRSPPRHPRNTGDGGLGRGRRRLHFEELPSRSGRVPGTCRSKPRRVPGPLHARPLPAATQPQGRGSTPPPQGLRPQPQRPQHQAGSGSRLLQHAPLQRRQQPAQVGGCQLPWRCPTGGLLPDAGQGSGRDRSQRRSGRFQEARPAQVQ